MKPIAPRAPRSRTGSGSVIGHLVALLGMTADDVVKYLEARGHDYSIHSVRSWTKGVYNPPAIVLDMLWEIWLAFADDLEATPLPPGSPQSVQDRYHAIYSMREWISQTYPERSE